MKTLKNRTLTENQRQEIYCMAENEETGLCSFRSLRYRLNQMYAELEKSNGKPAYSAKDAMYQSLSDRSRSFKNTGRY